MTDRELLELAAKAAGYEVLDWYGERYTTTDGDRLFPWNPLLDDGDALRLAVKLGISITPYPIYNDADRHSVIAKQRRQSDLLREANPTEAIAVYGDDPASAWRRAITRAAAEIGRAMG